MNHQYFNDIPEGIVKLPPSKKIIIIDFKMFTSNIISYLNIIFKSL